MLRFQLLVVGKRRRIQQRRLRGAASEVGEKPGVCDIVETE